MASQSLIVLFEDTPKNLQRIRNGILKFLSTSDVILIDFLELFNSDNQTKYKTGLSFDVVEGILENNAIGIVEMVIVDVDLSQYKEFSINEPVISNICDKLGIPICVYSTQVDESEIERIKNWSEKSIILNRNQDITVLSKHCVAIYRGFKKIREEFGKFTAKKFQGPIELLAKVMDAPNSAEAQMALYETGYFSVFSKSVVESEARNRTFPILLGYWLFNSLLRFPGVLLNDIATASYLNIDLEEFRRNKKVREIFDDAMYDGPFSDITSFWWKDRLDERIATAEVEKNMSDVQALLKSEGIRQVPPARCIEGEHDGAGFYCIITKEAVCEKHSVGNISWIPAGAVISRIKKSKWDELGPWFGF